LVLVAERCGCAARGRLARPHAAAPDSRAQARNPVFRQRDSSRAEREERSPGAEEKHRRESRRDPDRDEAKRRNPEEFGHEHEVDEEPRQRPGGARGGPKEEKSGLGCSPGHGSAEGGTRSHVIDDNVLR
jgi:hypothetical protein